MSFAPTSHHCDDRDSFVPLIFVRATVLWFSSSAVLPNGGPMPFDPTLDSVRTHQVPDWFHDAKLGIFVHWGLYSVPAWAPTKRPSHEAMTSDNGATWFRNNPYAEWYANSLRVPGSSALEHHAREYGADYAYDDFVGQFNTDTGTWNPATWAELFREAGAGYVVLTTKHHDGFLLWPSATPNPTRPRLQARRDLVGDLTTAVRAEGLKMGLYYSGGLDWTFNDLPITTFTDLFQGVPQSAEYVRYADAHLRELTERYRPSVLWNDIAYPADSDLPALFAEYYNQVPEGVINDRWVQGRPEQIDLTALGEGGLLPQPAHFDFRTPEYAVFDDIKTEKWEACRGLGFSFGYNRNEDDTTILSPIELIYLFVDIVSKNGNLLLNVGPMSDGTIPQAQADRLRMLGAWLKVNGEAIYASRPWSRAEGRTQNGIGVRFTARGAALYAIVLGSPQAGRVVIEDVPVAPGATVTLLGSAEPLLWEQSGHDLAVTLPLTSKAPAYTLRIG
jgi:alpha-L-fucosidase